MSGVVNYVVFEFVFAFLRHIAYDESYRMIRVALHVESGVGCFAFDYGARGDWPQVLLLGVLQLSL